MNSTFVTPHNAPFSTYKAARVHHALGGAAVAMAARGARAGRRNAHDRLAQPEIGQHQYRYKHPRCVAAGLEPDRICRGQKSQDRISFWRRTIRSPAGSCSRTGAPTSGSAGDWGRDAGRPSGASRETTTIPIIFATASDPVQDGIVKSINRPDGNSTGMYVLNTALMPKRLELLRELVPNARLVGFLVNPNNSNTGDQIRLAQSAVRTMDSSLCSAPPRRAKSIPLSPPSCSAALTDW